MVLTWAPAPILLVPWDLRHPSCATSPRPLPTRVCVFVCVMPNLLEESGWAVEPQPRVPARQAMAAGVNQDPRVALLPLVPGEIRFPSSLASHLQL